MFFSNAEFYRRFLPNSASTQYRLNEFLKDWKKNDKRPITWTAETISAFEKCKTDLQHAATLSFYSPGQKLSLMVDASDIVIGAVLQTHSDHGPQPLGFFSRKPTSAEKKYSTFDRELLAIYSSVKHFRHSLEGHNFIIFTDHRPLTFAITKPSDSASPRQNRHLSYISQFSTDIRHVSGANNVVADALSRIQEINSSVLNFEILAKAQETDLELQNILNNGNVSLKLTSVPISLNLNLWCNIENDKVKPFVPSEYRKAIFDSLHNLSHPGIRATKRLVLDRYVWPSISKDVISWTRACVKCQQSKVNRHTHNSIQPFLKPAHRFDYVHIELVDPLPPSEGYSYILTCVDRYTRWPEAIPISDISAETVARAVVTH